MRFLVHAAMSASLAASLIVSDVAHAAALGGAGMRGPSGGSSDFDDEARYRHNEAAWKRIATSVCIGCGGPAPKLEILRKRQDITRLERQAGIGVPLEGEAPAVSSSRAETGTGASSATKGARAPSPLTPPVTPPVARSAEPRPIVSKTSGTGPTETGSSASRPVVRTAQRPVLRSRTAIRLARLRQVRDRARLAALKQRRLAARRLVRLAQAPAGRRRILRARPVPALALAHSETPLKAPIPAPLRRPWPLPYRIDADARETALAARSRAIVCLCSR